MDNKVRYESSAFLSKLLKVFTVLSVRPFPCGKYGLLVMWWIEQEEVNCSKMMKSNCGPLSLIISPGKPCLKNIVFWALITLWKLREVNLTTSGYLEK